MKRIKNYSWVLAVTALCITACNSQPKNNDVTEAVNSGWKLGVALYSFNTISYANAMASVDSAKIKYVEGFSFYKLGKEYNDKTMGDLSKEDIAKMRDQMEKSNVKMVSMYVGGGNTVEAWKQTFENAKAFGVEYVTCEPVKQQWDMIDSLAGVYNIKVALHNHWKDISIYWSPDSVLAAVKGHPNFSACADLGHWVRSGLDPAECLRKLEGHILGMHVKDVDRKGTPETKDVIVGTGVIDYAKVIAELKRQKYQGMMYVECEHNFGYNLPDIIQSIDFINKETAK